ncbi:MAG: FtsX-like permease family protein [Rikenellaceae bacterium]
MSVEYFIAKRSAETKSGGRPSIMVRVATISVALSVAIMIISLAIVFGFKREVSRSLTGFIAQATMSNTATFNGSQYSPIRINPQLEELMAEQFKVTSMAPYATLQGVVRSSEGIEGVMMRGVDSLYQTDFLLSSLTAGDLPRLGEDSPKRDVLISSSLARRLGLDVGDRLELIINQMGESLRRDLFKISGLYSTGLDEWDRMVLVTDIRNVQRLNSWEEDQVSGYELRFESLSTAGAMCTEINDELLYGDHVGIGNMMAITSESLYPSIFDWLKAHNINAVVIIVIMLIVAGFNMATALLIMVLERTRMIGVLKALGMDNSSLQRIFLYRALHITLYGLAWGNGVSLTLCALQERFHFLRLDAESYLLSHVPIELGVVWILALNIAVIAAILALMIIPTRMVSKIKIEKTLKAD